MVSQIGIELARYLLGIEEIPRTGGLSARNLRLIDERLTRDGVAPSLEELAVVCGLSVRHLTRAFRASRRCSIGDYIAECRIQRAMLHLEYILSGALDVLCDLMPVSGAENQGSQDEHVQRALQQLSSI